MRLKAQVYKTMVRPVILYGAETWAVKEEHVKKLEVVEMRCLRAIRGVTRRERMRNEDIRQELKVAELREKIRECRLRWYGHVKRMEENEFVRWSAERREPGTRRRGRPRKRWMGCVRDDVRVVDLDKVDDRIEWKMMMVLFKKFIIFPACHRVISRMGSSLIFLSDEVGPCHSWQHNIVHTC